MVGKCALCRRICELSFEHIPPKAAFNSTPVKPVSWKEMVTKTNRVPWDLTGLPYQNQQKGMGLNSLCETCNNKTGTLYGKEYSAFIERIFQLATTPLDPKFQSVEIKDVYPARICKQIISMFCSVNPDANIEDLRRFVLDKTAVGIDKRKYKLCMYFTRSKVKRFNGKSAIIYCKEESVSIVSEITAYPAGYLLYFDPTNEQEYKGVDITTFADYKYDDICNIKMPINFYEVNNWLSHDYRTKADILGNDLFQENNSQNV